MLSSFQPTIAFSALMDKPATFTFWQDGNPVRYVNGIVSRFSQEKRAQFVPINRMVVEPALIRAALQSDSRIFQHQPSEKIFRTLLQKNRVDNVT
ncbi:hypothetical protein BKG89_01775 [Rodentibacter caecimuris]|uniref:Uncharacterized protein n=2 Tax=Rodentibacter caecimuris TaxID=1796644 RepID=A0ABX3L050_9PAST|nr:hypothetical protein BKG89_01775 [Rodentibacter heylii]